MKVKSAVCLPLPFQIIIHVEGSLVALAGTTNLNFPSPKWVAAAPGHEPTRAVSVPLIHIYTLAELPKSEPWKNTARSSAEFKHISVSCGVSGVSGLSGVSGSSGSTVPPSQIAVTLLVHEILSLSLPVYIP